MGCCSSCCRPRRLPYICDLVNKNRVILFSKTRCVDCLEVKRMLNEMGHNYTTVEIDLCDDGTVAKDLTYLTGYKTVPLLFINGVFIGSKYEVAKLKFCGRLQEMIGQNAPRRHNIGPMFDYAKRYNRYF
ncbi:glutaredoxin-like [Cimex lectularius]|uniref:Glutaredoxin domain-containing protein n=1 Tax=Cimex lectularius TaxID=79782 RepID=A0A8I6S9Z2_CIMLE|nr:glutaredoxin-like [Cimex lectularius]